MKDADLRELERALESGDPGARSDLERAWIASGRGWHGEILPANDRGIMLAGDERMSWRWRVAGHHLEIPMVYVPAGEVRCETCHGTGWNESHSFSGPERHPCETCHDPKPGWRRVRAFYLGRFPLTWGEFRAFCFATNGERLPTFPWEDLRPEHVLHPVVRVSCWDAWDFCRWSGLRLPTPDEWQFAALGAPVPHPEGHIYEDEHVGEDDFPRVLSRLYCLRCGDSGYGLHERPCLVSREFPWEGRDVAPPGVIDLGPQADEVIVYGVDCTKRVVDDHGRPARPRSASWCGAHDMVGHVWEWCTDAFGRGGSYASGPSVGQAKQVELGDDVGFRVAVDAVES